VSGESANQAYASRRRKLEALLKGRTALFHNGYARSRNLTSVGYPFRASSHVLYFAGLFPPGSILSIGGGEAVVYVETPSLHDSVWEGAGPDWTEYSQQHGIHIQPKNTLSGCEAGTLALPALDERANRELANVLGRTPDLAGPDRELALAVVEVRLTLDDEALSDVEEAIRVTADAFRSARRALSPGASGFEILAELEAVGRRNAMTPSFEPIVTNRGEEIHGTFVPRDLKAGELLLVDFGLETQSGFCSDVTRVWPVSGFTSEQRTIYELVLEVQRRSMAKIKIGTLWGEVHLEACKAFAEGLVSIGLLRGNCESLVERGAHTLFFPHGIGHLLGADVHDMEDLGDLAGYGDGQVRDSRFGFCYLRLNRKLRERMLVTVEPGFYWIPAVFQNKELIEPLRDCIDLERILRFKTVRGIRIEDDVLVDKTPRELTAAIPKSTAEIE